MLSLIGCVVIALLQEITQKENSRRIIRKFAGDFGCVINNVCLQETVELGLFGGGGSGGGSGDEGLVERSRGI